MPPRLPTEFPPSTTSLETLVEPTHLLTVAEVFSRFGDKQADWTELRGLASVHGHFFCEYFTRDYVDNLAVKLRALLEGQAAPTILEVGAGSGRLTHFLTERLPEMTIIATDELPPNPGSLTMPVEEADYRDALDTYRPQIVLSSWMPKNEDWTAAFRTIPNLQAYILIGETGADGASGTAETWDPSIYEAAGFSATECTLAPIQFNAMTNFRHPSEDIYSASRTIVFERTA
jgi:hypothetical protein